MLLFAWAGQFRFPTSHSLMESQAQRVEAETGNEPGVGPEFEVCFGSFTVDNIPRRAEYM